MKSRIELLAAHLVDEQALTIITTAVNEVLELAAVKSENLPAPAGTKFISTYEAATLDCAEAIRKMKV